MRKLFFFISKSRRHTKNIRYADEIDTYFHWRKKPSESYCRSGPEKIQLSQWINDFFYSTVPTPEYANRIWRFFLDKKYGSIFWFKYKKFLGEI